MRAVVWEGKPFHVSVKSVPKPKIIAEEDAIVRLTTAAICGTDLHTYHGIFGSTNPPWTLGHEGIGVVVEVGSATKSIKVGDRVIVPDFPDDGHLTLRAPDLSEDVAFGFGPDFGNLGGLQAEYARVPFADDSLIPIPNNRHSELDYLFISDIWATAWTCIDFSGFQPGDSVAVFGAGPVGLLCAYSALLRGASKVYSVDHVPSRLEKAKSIGAIPINFTHNNAAEQILKLEPNGVTRSCDCCGYECLNTELKPQQNAIINDMVHVTAANGGIGVIGVYVAQPAAPGRPNADQIAPTIDFPITEFWAKNLKFQAGAADPKPIAATLEALVASGRAKPSFIVSSELGIEEAKKGYERFDKHKETKVVIRFPWEKEGDSSEEEEM
ncbi:hypothetical protein BDV96DRAFT_499850 [Lophiotrema nucula]|uniref:Alcohol dehydrogenase n=1 Tax=Lophiotrema nucula TaxID=690887 RepID=A0A6A5YV69_9PLEO|nr:hypothetical protein BDV96DRAFT_499850 [Lophiotrema nucula]